MKTLLIVEDEKMIRQGIATMARRCSVSIENILECRNGVEALEILEEKPVDVMFTDIRMPKMDGIELVKRTAQLNNPPMVVVVSGFDDFNYAVEMMKNGVRDYLLKPIKRDKVEEVLAKLDKELEQVYRDEEADMRNLRNQFRYLLLNDRVEDSEWELVGQQIARLFTGGDFFENGYVAGVGASAGEGLDKLCFRVTDVEGQDVILADAGSIKEVKSQMCGNMHPGFSAVHKSFTEVKTAYEEALAAREKAFVTGTVFVEWERIGNRTAAHRTEDKNGVNEEFELQFVNQFATERLKDALRRLENMYFEAKHHQDEYDGITAMTERIRQKLEENYGKLLVGEGKNTASCQQVLSYGTSEEFLENFSEWVLQMKAELKVRFDNDQNQEKIQKAIEYIRENYQKELNMAMVSNYVSMNYSLFSVTFKEYTGVNFVNYLKDIRIEQAKKLLTETDEKIVDISRMVGYENEKHFMKTFRNVCGVSPSEYRKGTGLPV